MDAEPSQPRFDAESQLASAGEPGPPMPTDRSQTFDERYAIAPEDEGDSET